MDDGRTLDQRRCGKTWKRPVVEFGESVHCRPVGENNALRGGDQRLLRGFYVGHHERSGVAIFLTPDGVKRGTRIARMLEHERWDRVFSATCVGVPWKLRPDQRNLARLVVPVAEADQGVAPVIVMLAVPRVERQRMMIRDKLNECLVLPKLKFRVQKPEKRTDGCGRTTASPTASATVSFTASSHSSRGWIIRLRNPIWSRFKSKRNKHRGW